MKRKVRIFQEGWMFFLISVFDAGLTYVLVRYHGYEERNPIMVSLYRLLGNDLINLIILKLVLSFFIIILICYLGRAREKFTRDLLKLGTAIYFVSLVFIMILFPRLIYLFILLHFKF